jgi:putative two-component system hydrogenase maturation factor HypX/HoxX
MRILLIASAFNSMTQRLFVELDDLDYDVACTVASNPEQMRAAVDDFEPELVIAPYLKTAIPEDLWRSLPCLIVHPGIRGDRGPSSLDWAILRGAKTWGVTVLQAAEEFDAGDIWASREFVVGDRPKSALYRDEVADAAVEAVLEAIEGYRNGTIVPQPLDYSDPRVRGRLERPMKQPDREIDWSASTQDVLRRMRCSDSTPGVVDTIFGERYHLFGGHTEGELRGRPGDVLGYRDGAICRATGDGAVWITHLKQAARGAQTLVKLPAATILASKLTGFPERSIAPDEAHEGETWREIRYEEHGEVGALYFDFYNGAMSTEQCIRLRQAYEVARARPTKVIVLHGGEDLWSNGIHLNVIETAVRPSAESWANITAMDDLVREILETPSHVVISAMAGNSGAGGVPLALAADEVCARPGVVLNPHYKGMGLFGSEYWTYLLPRRVGMDMALELTNSCLPISARRSKAIGLIDHVFGRDCEGFRAQVHRLAAEIAYSDGIDERLREKRAARRKDECARPLSSYRFVELTRMQRDFAGAAYRHARESFVRKLAGTGPFTHPSAERSVIHSNAGSLPAQEALAV